MPASGDVSRIHAKYSLTLLTPSSYLLSLAMSVGLVAAVAAVVHAWYGAGWGWGQEGGHLPLLASVAAAAAALAATQAADSRIIRNKEYSKALHMSLFGSVVWLLVCLSGLAAHAVLGGGGQGAPAEVAALGAFVFASFRLGILTTTLGVGLRRAWAICLAQPVAVLLAVAGPEAGAALLADPATAGLGLAFLGITTAWSRLTDRAGRPGVRSTHRLVQAYLSSRSSDHAEIEEMIEGSSRHSSVSTSQLRLVPRGGGPDVRLVLPGIHPGPYHPIGGSNIPYLICRSLGSSAMVMHSISDHALNLPSRKQVESYLSGLSAARRASGGSGPSCTEPVAVQINRSRVLGLRFGRNALLFLSLSPHGMEDLPTQMKSEVESYARNRGFGRAMLVDCHNAMGGEISGPDAGDMLKAAKSCLDTLMARDDHPFEFGYAGSAGADGTDAAEDLGMGGLGMLCLRLGGRRYLLGWADSNNMENGVREYVVSRLGERGHRLLEICTSDTHFSQTTVRTKQGYYQFGLVTPMERIAGWYLEMARRAEADVRPATFEVLESSTRVKVMGPKIFADYTAALDRALLLSKSFMAGCVALFVAGLLLLR